MTSAYFRKLLPSLNAVFLVRVSVPKKSSDDKFNFLCKEHLIFINKVGSLSIYIHLNFSKTFITKLSMMLE